MKLHSILGATCLAILPNLAFAGEGIENSAGLDLGFYSRSEDNASFTMVSPLAHVMVGVGRKFGVGMDWGFVYVKGSSDVLGDSSDSRFQIGNPFIAGYYLAGEGNLRLQLGAGVALPLATIPADKGFAEQLLAGSGYVSAAGARGVRDMWLWSPEHLGFVAPVSLELEGGPLVLGVDAAAAVLVYVGDDITNESDVVIQLAPRAGVRLGPVTVGARVTEVLLVTSEADDKSQLALEPFAEADFGAAYARAAMTINIDEPGGFAFDEGKIWGLHVGAGARF